MTKLSVAAIGHVDHGKSSLMGRILYSCGFIEERDAEKLKKEAEADKMGSWWLSRILDTDRIEQERGKTHQFMYVDFETREKEFRLIDVPGHRLMVSQMVEGVAMADVALLVVSARKGELEQGLAGQTMEHLMITRGMGIKRVVVAVNKMDCVDWDLDAYEKIVANISKRLKALRMNSVEFVPVSAITGDNVAETKPLTKDTRSLLDVLVSTEAEERASKRVPVVDGRIVTKFMFCNLQAVATVGMKFMVHTKDGVFNGEIVNLKNGDKRFVTSNERGAVVMVAIKIEEPVTDIDSKLIVRDGDSTIGFGEALVKKT